MTRKSQRRLARDYRPTFLPTTPTSNDATHDYLDIKTPEEAKRIAEQARKQARQEGLDEFEASLRVLKALGLIRKDTSIN